MATTELSPESKENGRRRSSILLAIIILVAAVIVIGVIVKVFSASSMTQEGVEMEAYLNSKYNKQFVVDEPQRDGASLGSKGFIRANAHPKDNSSITFSVKSSHTLSDTYPLALWAHQERKPVGDFLNKVYVANIPDYKIEIGLEPALLQKISGDVPDFDEAITTYRASLGYMIYITSTDNFTEKGSSYYGEKIVQIRDFISQKNVKSPGIKYVVNLPGEDARYRCSIIPADFQNVNVQEAANCFSKVKGRE
jgi:hypothetical protein